MTLELITNRSVDGKAPPWSPEAEVAVLGACLIDPSLIPRVAGIVRPDHFASGRHRFVFAAILAVHATGRPIDVVSVGEHLRDEGRMPQVGGMAVLTEIMNAEAVNLPAVTEHARLVFDKWRVREAIRVHQQAIAVGYNDCGDAQEFIGSSRRALDALLNVGDRLRVQSNLEALKGLVVAIRASAKAAGEGGVSGIPTGLRPYDVLTAGLHSGELTVVGARPGVGKSALLGQWAANVASRGVGVGFISLEMGQAEIMQRTLCSRGGIDAARLRTGQMTHFEWSRFHEVANEITKWPLWFDDRKNRNIHQLRESAHGFIDFGRARGVPLGALFVDYMQYIAPAPEKARAPLREALAHASKGLKELAAELGVPIVCAAALNRDVDKAGKVRWPRMSDLRDCGNIESDADNIVLLHREARVRDDREEVSDDGAALLIVDKQRSGRPGTVKLWFEGHFARFSERRDGDTRPCS